MGLWLEGACQEARMEVDDRGVRDGASGVAGGMVCRSMVTVAVLELPIVYALLEVQWLR